MQSAWWRESATALKAIDSVMGQALRPVEVHSGVVRVALAGNAFR
jgi:hypothetical protein